jgi:uncharacterized protein
MHELWSALSLVAIIEGLFLFVTPEGWKRTAEQLYAMPSTRLRAMGGAVVIIGLVSLHLIRGG